MQTNRKVANRIAVVSDDGRHSTGYGLPPENTQFKPGVSGNPSGRRKKSPQVKSIGQFIRDYLKGTVPAREGGKLKQIPRMDAVMHRFFAAAMNGHPATARQLLQLALDDEEIGDAAPPVMELSPEDLETLRDYLKRKDDKGEPT